MLFCLLSMSNALSQRAQRNYLAENKYLDGIVTLENQLPGASRSTQKELYERLMRLYFAYAELADKAWAASSEIGTLYFNILEEQGESFDPLSLFYRGLYAFEAAYYEDAEKHFSAYKRGPPHNSLLSEFAAIWLGGTQYMLGKKGLASSTWNAVSVNNDLLRNELEYVKSRIGAGNDTYQNGGLSVSKSTNDNRSIRNAIQRFLRENEFNLVRDLVHRIDFTEPSHIVNQGTDLEVRYYDPSIIKIAANAFYGLSAWYAKKLNEIIIEDEQYRIMTPFYKGFYFYQKRSYQNAIEFFSAVRQTGDEQRQKAALYLAAAYFLDDRRETADRVFSYLESHGNEEIRSSLGLLYYTINYNEKYNDGEQFTVQALENAKKRYGRRLPQIYHRNLGELYNVSGQYGTAFEVFGEGYRSEMRGDIRYNAPMYSLGYGQAIVLGRFFNSLPDAIEMFTEVSYEYEVIHPLVELTVELDVFTNRENLDGRSRLQTN